MAHCHLSNAEFYDWLYKHAYPQDWKKEKRDREYQTALEKWKKNREQNFPPQDGTR